jgi:hypothetical protein
MAETREKTKDTPGTASGMAEKVGDQGKESSPASKDKPQEAPSSVVGAVKEKMHDMAASVGSSAVQAKDKAQEVVSAAAEKVGKVGQEVTALIRRYPLPALLMGVGVGFLLAKLLQGPSPAKT